MHFARSEPLSSMIDLTQLPNRLGRAALVGPEEAAARIPDGATIAVSGGGYRVAPESLLSAIEQRFLEEQRPRELSLVAISMIEQSRAGKGGAGTGLNRLARPGLVREIICSSFSRADDLEINQLILGSEVQAHNLPMGTIVQWLRAVSAGHPFLLTEVGLETYIDPRNEGGRMNAATQSALGQVVVLGDREMIQYPTRPIDVALIKATSADTRGNLYLDREAFTHGILYTAMAAHNSGGLVLAQVDRIVETGEIHPRMGRVPGSMIDAVTVSPDLFEDEQDPVLTGEKREILHRERLSPGPRAVIAHRAIREIPAHGSANLGAGIPMYEVPAAAHYEGRDDVYFSIEQGPIGGLPRVGGVARNPDMIFDQLEVFDYYEGGGPDVTILSFGEIDRYGNVNVSRFGNKMPGCGGFPNIAHRIPNIVLCGTLTTGGLRARVTENGVTIQQEGSIRRFVESVDQVTFSGPRALRNGQRITVITERCVLAVTQDGFIVIEIAAGIDFEQDIRKQADFEITLSKDVRLMDSRLFSPKTRGDDSDQ